VIKIQLEDLKKAVKWLEANTNQLTVNVVSDGSTLVISSFDRQDKDVQITLYQEGTYSPKVRKTEAL
jgi:hypothetical protein